MKILKAIIQKIFHSNMNPNSKELRNELNILSKKYDIKRGIFLFEENKKDIIKNTGYRVILIEEGASSFNVNAFAFMFNKCMEISKSFQKILDKVSEISFIELLKDMDIHHKLHHEKGKTKN